MPSLGWSLIGSMSSYRGGELDIYQLLGGLLEGFFCYLVHRCNPGLGRFG